MDTFTIKAKILSSNEKIELSNNGEWRFPISSENIIKAANFGNVSYLKNTKEHPPFAKFLVLVACLENNNVDFFNAFIEKYPIDDLVVLFVAARYGHLEIAKQIIAKHPEYVNKKFCPCSITETGLEVKDIRKLMNEPDLTPEEEYEFDYNEYIYDIPEVYEVFRSSETIPLHMAVLSGNLELVKFLVEQGALINSSANDDMDRFYPIGCTIMGYKFHKDIFLYFLSIGVDVELNGFNVEICSEEADEFITRFNYEPENHDLPEFTEKDKQTEDFFKDLIKRKGMLEAAILIHQFGNTTMYPLIKGTKVQIDKLPGLERSEFFKYVTITK
jgi:ankyrin repeat protein